MGGSIFMKFLGFAGLQVSSQRFGPEVGGGSNFGGRGGLSGQKWLLIFLTFHVLEGHIPQNPEEREGFHAAT